MLDYINLKNHNRLGQRCCFTSPVIITAIKAQLFLKSVKVHLVRASCQRIQPITVGHCPSYPTPAKAFSYNYKPMAGLQNNTTEKDYQEENCRRKDHCIYKATRPLKRRKGQKHPMLSRSSAPRRAGTRLGRAAAALGEGKPGDHPWAHTL